MCHLPAFKPVNSPLVRAIRRFSLIDQPLFSLPRYSLVISSDIPLTSLSPYSFIPSMLWLPSLPQTSRFGQFVSSTLRNIVTQRLSNPKTLANLISLPRFSGSELSQLRSSTKASGAFSRTAAFAGLGLGLSFLKPATIHCERMSVLSSFQPRVSHTITSANPPVPGPPVASRTPDVPAPSPPPHTSIVNIYELSFGTVCGLCAGVFVKKGAIALAYVFGGIFVLLQVCAVVESLDISFSSPPELV